MVEELTELEKKVNDLPRIFDEYNDVCKANFMKVKRYKEEGGKLAGYLCSYAPLEILDAAGFSAVGLCGTSNGDHRSRRNGASAQLVPAHQIHLRLCPYREVPLHLL